MKKNLLILSVSCLAGALAAQQANELGAPALKARAYELYQARRLPEAAAQFETYLAANAGDAKALFDYASLLVQLNRHADAARQFELLHQRFPPHEAGYFKLGVEYVALEQSDDARRVFTELQKSANSAMASAATDALARLTTDVARAATQKAEAEIFELARQSKHAEVIAAVAGMEKQGPLSHAMQMQRLYSLSALQQYAPALARADKLAEANPGGTDLALVRADLLAQVGRRSEAETLWRRLASENAGTPVALQATERLENKPTPDAEDAVFTLVRQQRHREAVAAIDELDKSGALSSLMEMQRIYSLQHLGEHARALELTERFSAANPDSTDASLLQADLLIRSEHRQKAARVLKRIKDEHPGTPAAQAAEERLHALPPIANLDKWFWGEAYVSGDYLGRYGTVVGSGFIRQGAFIPNARWLQPYGEFRFGADTRSGAGARETIIADNQVGFYGGMRAQLFESEYLFIYGQGGVNEDLLDQRDREDWALDYQGGIYGFKSWGPGTAFRPSGPEKKPVSVDARAPDSASTNGFFWRGDWFIDAGADFSYYHRYTSWIGYGQAREGFRVFQVGPKFAFDAYLVENLTWDVRGNFYDNSFAFGPGARCIWLPYPNWQVVLRAEWMNGFYFGRDELDNRGNADGHYDGVVVGLSVGARW
jgi:TolA-binding protein